MINEDIKKYVANQRAAGFSDNDIRGALQGSGWSDEDITTLLQPATPPPQATTPDIPTPTNDPAPEAATPEQPTPARGANSSPNTALIWFVVALVVVAIVAIGGFVFLTKMSKTPVHSNVPVVTPTASSTPTKQAAKQPTQPTTPAPATPATTTSTLASSSSTAAATTNINDYAAKFYAAHNDSYKKLCTDPSIQAFMKKVRQSSNGTTNCNSGTTTYRITLQVAPNQINCLDSTGLATTVPSLPQNAFLCLPPKQ